MTPLSPFRPPYPADALEPYLGEEAVKLHFELTRGYIERANKLITAHGKGKLIDQNKLDFEVSGAMLHRLWWENLAPPSPGRRVPKVPKVVTDTFEGSGARALKRELVAAGMAIEGSGWVALVRSKRGGGGSAVVALKNHYFAWASLEPLLLIDVWEHAYICEYGPGRQGYLKDVLKLVNWAEVARRIS